ncbi:brachyurin-like [Hetaerina americana]|uniref:brachyurin-like n=1 Tax=Hetaerina americana TaxID=62018 RepID=UPI003A7F43DB
MRAILASLFFLVICAAAQSFSWHTLRPVVNILPEQPVTGEQYEARLKTLQKSSRLFYMKSFHNWFLNHVLALHRGSRIVGGETAQLGQFPYQAAVNIDAGYFCGGSLISNNYVVTAGHCGVLGDSFTINLGSISPDKSESTRLVVRSTEPHVHEEYDPNTLYGDICLLKLSQSIEFNENIAAIALPSFSSDPPMYENTQVIASGWGKTSDGAGSISSTLQYTPLTTITNDECAQFYGDTISISQICARGDNYQSTCNGDSGGPLAAQDSGAPLLIGVISFVSGNGCESGYPSGYTRVTTFRQWISNNSDA